MVLKKKNSCKRFLEEKNCMQHKWNKKQLLHGCKKGKMYVKKGKFYLLLMCKIKRLGLPGYN